MLIKGTYLDFQNALGASPFRIFFLIFFFNFFLNKKLLFDRQGPSVMKAVQLAVFLHDLCDTKLYMQRSQGAGGGRPQGR